jgi:hypothetical protein
MQHWAWTQKENKDIKAKRNLTQKNNMSFIVRLFLKNVGPMTG